MSLTAWIFLTLVAGVAAGGILVAAAYGLGWLVGRAEEHRRMPAPHSHEVDD